MSRYRSGANAYTSWYVCAYSAAYLRTASDITYMDYQRYAGDVTYYSYFYQQIFYQCGFFSWCSNFYYSNNYGSYPNPSSYVIYGNDYGFALNLTDAAGVSYHAAPRISLPQPTTYNLGGYTSCFSGSYGFFYGFNECDTARFTETFQNGYLSGSSP